MKALLRFKKELIGVVVGGIVGFVYYYFIGCSTNTCTITSSPYLSTLYGAVLGGLFINTFSTSKKNNSSNGIF